jgi:hypothetical protein
MTVRGSWLTNAPFCFCFSFPSSLIFGPFFFCFIFFFLCLCSLVFDYVSVSFVMSSLRLLPCSLFPGFFCVLPWVSPPIFSLVCVLCPPLSISLYILSVYSLLLSMCVCPSSFFFVLFFSLSTCY